MCRLTAKMEAFIKITLRQSLQYVKACKCGGLEFGAFMLNIKYIINVRIMCDKRGKMVVSPILNPFEK